MQMQNFAFICKISNECVHFHIILDIFCDYFANFENSHVNAEYWKMHSQLFATMWVKNFAKICQCLQAEVDKKTTNKLCEKKQTNTSTVGI